MQGHEKVAQGLKSFDVWGGGGPVGIRESMGLHRVLKEGRAPRLYGFQLRHAGTTMGIGSELTRRMNRAPAPHALKPRLCVSGTARPNAAISKSKPDHAFVPQTAATRGGTGLQGFGSVSMTGQLLGS